MSKPKDVVILRKFVGLKGSGLGGVHDVVALFPEIPGTADPHSCLSWGLDGHASSDRRLIYATEPLSETSHEGLWALKQLKRIGYNPMVVKRWEERFDRVRQAALQAMKHA